MHPLVPAESEPVERCRFKQRLTVVFVTHDIPEAIYLGSRVVVLASHPGRVIADIDVPFGAGHDSGVTRDPRYLDLRDEIEDLLGSTP